MSDKIDKSDNDLADSTIEFPFWVTDINQPRSTIEEIRNSTIAWKHRENRPLTPQEELFKYLYNHEKPLVKDMNDLTLQVHREELAKIAFEARVRMTAADDEIRSRKPKTEGFKRSLQTDDITSDAINSIKIRQAKMTKMDKVKASLIAMGVSETDAEKMISAGSLKASLDKIDHSTSPINPNKTRLPETPKIPVFNPFEKKAEKI